MLYAHGCFHSRKKPKTTVPMNLSVYFYVPHGIASADGAIRPVVENTPAQGNRVADFGNGVQFLNWAPGSVTSIAGPGTIVYDYELSWNEKSRQFVRLMNKAVSEQANYPKDLIIVDAAKKGVNSKLSALFTAMAQHGMRYKILHYLPCRSPIGEDDFNPGAVNAAEAFKKLVR
jgi:hypothetical protein